MPSDSLKTFTKDSLDSFNNFEMPSKLDRPWRYTDISHIQFEPNELKNLDYDVRIDSNLVDGITADHVTKENIDEFHKIFSENLGSTQVINPDKFSLTNDAFWHRGIFVHAKKNVVMDEPIKINIVSNSVSMLPRILVYAEENSEIRIQLSSSSELVTKFVISTIEIIAEKSAHIKLFITSNLSNATEEFLYVRGNLDQNADFELGLLPISGKLFKHTVENSIIGEGANASIKGFALGDDEQHFDFVTIQDHIGKKSTSHVDIRSALGDSSRNVYYGITRVEESAFDAEAEQSNRNLLLSSNAKADSDPVLEILTSHVIKCGHAATVGPLDNEAVYYLQSRGLSSKEATKLLVSGSFSETFSNMPFNDIQDVLLEVVNKKLEQLD